MNSTNETGSTRAPRDAVLARAFAFAERIHRGQVRKGSQIPYITHVMAVAAIVGEYGGSEDQMIAALLHDVVEEGDGLATLEEVRSQFGDRIAEWVRLCSDALAKPKPPWPDRKRAFIETVRSTPGDVRLVVAADKLHNARSIAADRAAIGDAVWERFTGKRNGTLWYYHEIRNALGDGWDHPILRELDSAIRALNPQSG